MPAEQPHNFEILLSGNTYISSIVGFMPNCGPSDLSNSGIVICRLSPIFAAGPDMDPNLHLG
jgi:hypothetical protein